MALAATEYFAHTPATRAALEETVAREVLAPLALTLPTVDRVVVEKCLERASYCDFVLSANSARHATAIAQLVARIKPNYQFTSQIVEDLYVLACADKDVMTRRQTTVVVRAFFDRSGALRPCANVALAAFYAVLLALAARLLWWLNYEMR